MLNKEELAAFLAMLLEFSTINQLSAAMCARVLNTSHASIARWLNMARAGSGCKTSVYRYMAANVTDKITRLNTLDSERGTYQAISTQPAQQKVDLLQRALDGKLVW